MTAQISAYGRLVADPQLKTTSKGTPMALVSMAVPIPCNQADDGQATMWLTWMGGFNFTTSLVIAGFTFQRGYLAVGQFNAITSHFFFQCFQTLFEVRLAP